MPPEKALPHAKVAHGRGDTSNIRDFVRFKQAVKLAQVPALVGDSLIEETHWCVCTVQGRIDGDSTPECSLFPVQGLFGGLLLFCDIFELRCSHLFLLF